MRWSSTSKTKAGKRGRSGDKLSALIALAIWSRTEPGHSDQKAGLEPLQPAYQHRDHRCGRER